jgi:hypothetical protein
MEKEVNRVDQGVCDFDWSLPSNGASFLLDIILPPLLLRIAVLEFPGRREPLPLLTGESIYSVSAVLLRLRTCFT